MRRTIPEPIARIRVEPSLALVLVVAIEAVAVLGLLGVGNQPIIGADGPGYILYARNLIEHGVFSDAATAPYFPSVLRTPGYPLFLALFRLGFGNSLLVIRIAQFALIGATALFVYWIACGLTQKRTAMLAGLLCATYLPLIWLATAQMSEVLTAFLIAAIVWWMYRTRATSRHVYLSYGVLGGAVGALALVRPEFALCVAPIAVGMFLWDRRGSIVHRMGLAAVLLLACFAVLTPSTIRGASVAHRFLPFGTGSGDSLYVSAEQYAGRISYKVTPAEYARLYGPSGEFERLTRAVNQRLERNSARGASASGVPLGTQLELADNSAIEAAARREFSRLSVGQIISSLPLRLAYLWGTADYVPPGTALAVPAHRLGQVQWGLISVLIVVGLIVGLIRLRWQIWPLLLFPLYATAVHLVFHAEGRYTLTTRPVLMVLAAIGLAWLGERLALRRGNRTIVAAR